MQDVHQPYHEPEAHPQSESSIHSTTLRARPPGYLQEYQTYYGITTTTTTTITGTCKLSSSGLYKGDVAAEKAVV